MKQYRSMLTGGLPVGSATSVNSLDGSAQNLVLNGTEGRLVILQYIKRIVVNEMLYG